VWVLDLEKKKIVKIVHLHLLLLLVINLHTNALEYLKQFKIIYQQHMRILIKQELHFKYQDL